MVLMYHNIGEEEATWTRTPENFRRDLETLYNSGFRAISLEDYALGNIATEKGHTPVVITFDDGMKNNFRYLENGEIDPTCAIGILESFKADFQTLILLQRSIHYLAACFWKQKPRDRQAEIPCSKWLFNR